MSSILKTIGSISSVVKNVNADKVINLVGGSKALQTISQLGILPNRIKGINSVSEIIRVVGNIGQLTGWKGLVEATNKLKSTTGLLFPSSTFNYNLKPNLEFDSDKVVKILKEFNSLSYIRLAEKFLNLYSVGNNSEIVRILDTVKINNPAFDEDEIVRLLPGYLVERTYSGNQVNKNISNLTGLSNLIKNSSGYSKSISENGAGKISEGFKGLTEMFKSDERKKLDSELTPLKGKLMEVDVSKYKSDIANIKIDSKVPLYNTFREDLPIKPKLAIPFKGLQ